MFLVNHFVNVHFYVSRQRGMPGLDWQNAWHEIAFEISVDFANGVDVLSEEFEARTFEAMNAGDKSYIDWELEVFNVKSLEGDPVSAALGTLDGGDIIT